MSTELRPPIRGRDRELAVLDEQLDRLHAGAGAVVLVEGSPGIGKSRLLDEAAEMARRRATSVGIGVAEPAENLAELAPLLRALFDGQDALLDRRPELQLRGAPEQRYWLLQDLQSMLERASSDGPLLICLDDLQWADAGTVAALRILPARLASMPIGWVLAMRPGRGSAQLSRTVDHLLEGGAARLIVDKLDRTAVAQVAADTLRSEPDAALLHLAEDAGGNPFLLTELLLGLEEEHLVRVESGRASLEQIRIPARVGTSMHRRLSLMPEHAGQVAAAAASLGRTFSFADLATMLNLVPAALLTPVEQLVEAGILRERDGRLSFQHDLTRDAVRAASAASARQALDRQGAKVLLDAGALPVEVAAQLAASAEPGDAVAVTMLVEAAQTLGRSDPETAADLSLRALELAPPGNRARGPLVAQTILLLHAAARPDEAKTFADEHLTNVLPSAAEAEVCLSIANMFALSPDVRAAANRRALGLTGLPRRNRAQHVAGLAYNLIQAGRRERAQSLLRDTATVVTSGDVTASSVLRLAEAALLYGEGKFDQALKMHEDAMRRGFGDGGATRERVAYQWRCELLAVLDRLDDSLQLIAAGIADADRDRQGWALDFFETWRGRQLFQRGRLADAAAALEERFDPAEAHKIVGALYAAGVVALGRVAIHTGNERNKRETARLAEAMLDTGTPATRRHAAWLLALQAMADSDPARAREWLATADASADGAPILPLHPMDVTDEPHLVRLALACGDRELAAEAVDIAGRRAGYNPTIACINGALAHARGLLEDDLGQLAAAADLLRGGQRPLALGSALEDLGAAQLRRGPGEVGVEALGQALVVYTELGATWDARRVRRRLQARGIRRRMIVVDRPAHGWEALTTSELQVARLVAEGLTNREVAQRLFVSPHTVSGHLRHTFAKLAINSRVELAREAAERSVHSAP